MYLISHQILKEKKVTYNCILYYVNVDNFTRSIKLAFVMKGQSNISLHAYIADTYYCAEAAFMTTIQPQMKASFAVEVSTRLSRNKKSRRNLQCQSKMEAYHTSTEFGDDEFYHILETISPFEAPINEIELCVKCKSAPCSCKMAIKRCGK